jgi:hypothetical protein
MTTFVIVSFGKKYTKFKDALVNSIEANMPGSNIKVIQLPELRRVDFQVANYLKLKKWRDNIEGNTVLIDADTILLGDISEVFDMEYDLIYTKRNHNRTIPFNSGVVFVKESGRIIVDTWAKLDDRMYKDKRFHLEWKRKYYGFNQASFGCMLETMPELKIGQVEATIYNSCDRYDWTHNYDLAKIVHVKSELRTSVECRLNKFKEIESRILKYY